MITFCSKELVQSQIVEVRTHERRLVYDTYAQMLHFRHLRNRMCCTKVNLLFISFSHIFLNQNACLHDHVSSHCTYTATWFTVLGFHRFQIFPPLSRRFSWDYSYGTLVFIFHFQLWTKFLKNIHASQRHEPIFFENSPNIRTTLRESYVHT